MRKLITPLLLPLTGLAFFSVIILTVNVGINATSKEQSDIDTTNFPTLEYGSTPNEPKERARWQRKSRKYNKTHLGRITESTDGIYHNNDWEVGLPAFPVARSAAIVIGEITDARAYLSEDGSNVYSEFSIQVTEVLKNDALNTITTDVTLFVEREGGRVKFSSGKILTVRVNKQDMPRTGKRYVFFLLRPAPTGTDYDCLKLLTAYELREGRVFPLDHVSEKHPINQYKGKAEQEFETELRIAIARGN